MGTSTSYHPKIKEDTEFTPISKFEQLNLRKKKALSGNSSYTQFDDIVKKNYNKENFKTKSTSSLSFLNVLNNLKEATSSKSLSQTLDFKHFKFKRYKPVVNAQIKTSNAKVSIKEVENDDYENNNYIFLTPSKDSDKIIPKSMSYNNFKPYKVHVVSDHDIMNNSSNTKHYNNPMFISVDKSFSLIEKAKTMAVNKQDKQKSSAFDLAAKFSKLGSRMMSSFENQGYTSDKCKTLQMENLAYFKKTGCLDKNYDVREINSSCNVISANYLDKLNNNIVDQENSHEYKNTCNYNNCITKINDKINDLDVINNNAKNQMKNNAICVSILSMNDETVSNANNTVCPTKRVVMRATTPELLLCLGVFFKEQCSYLSDFDPSRAISWLRQVDRSLLLQGWQDIVFINPANIIFVYFLLSSELRSTKNEIKSVQNLQALVLTCFYLSYSYMGNEISYPSKPFLVEHETRDQFWDRCLRIINSRSSDMLKMNSDPTFFADKFSELKSYSPS